MSFRENCHRCGTEFVITPVRDDDGELQRMDWKHGSTEIFVDWSCPECEASVRGGMVESEYFERVGDATEERGQSNLCAFGGGGSL